MNVTQFFAHWRLAENPFAAEEARHDAVFAKLQAGSSSHPDFEKVLGDLSRPATAILFGEKGSGKTAIRMQIAQRIVEWNQARPDSRVLLIAYDDLNPFLDRFWSRLRAGDGRSVRRGAREEDPIRRLSLADHMDAILHLATVSLVDSCFARADKRPDAKAAMKALRQADPSVRTDFLVLQAVYDRPALAGGSTKALARAIRAPRNRARFAWTALAATVWIAPAALAGWLIWEHVALTNPAWVWGVGGAGAVWLLLLLKRWGLDQWRLRSVGRRVARRIRVLDRTTSSAACSLSRLPASSLAAGSIPIDGGDEARYEMFNRLRRVAGALGYSSVLIIVDRIDEPTLVSGDPDRMKSVVWPLLSSKFLQMEGIGLKLLLPIELRHTLFRESSAFFQEARLDKQNLIEQLSWTGATLYDLCTARLRACRQDAPGEISLGDLFAPDVRRQDVVDALDQMHQPRDAFKMLYRCIQEHCAYLTDDAAEADGAWRIPRLILESVRRQQVERLQQLARGMRPA